MSARILPINTYALKHRALGRNPHGAMTKCGDQPPPSAAFWQVKSGCQRPLYHKGPHRISLWRKGSFIWDSGDRAARRARGRQPGKKIGACASVPGQFCLSHRVRHYRPKEAAR